jgi:hypothetical protein
MVVSFQIEIVSGRSITPAPEVDFLQTIQLHVLFEGRISRSERVEFASHDPVFQFASEFSIE